MEHKKVIVTGGNRGIGKGIVLSLLDQGYFVLATSRDSKKFDMSHQNLEVANLDVCDQASIDDFQQIVNDFDPDILINNAGITKDNLFLRMTEDDWGEVIDTNLNSVFRMTKLVVRGMLKKKWGRIVLKSRPDMLLTDNWFNLFFLFCLRVFLNIAILPLFLDVTTPEGGGRHRDIEEKRSGVP